jgi:pseudomonalisin
MFLPWVDSCVPRRTILFLALTTLSLLRPCLVAAAQTVEGQSGFSVQPRDRVTGSIDDERRVVLHGNRHPLATAANDLGRVSGDFRMERVILTLKPDAAQQAALEQVIAAQHDSASPRYHRWLTPEEYGRSFGASENDLQQIANWLHTHGLDSIEIGASHNSIVFGGVAAQVEAAFHTQIHVYRVGGELHHANASDPEIPDALSAVVAGIVSLHDFRSEPMHTAVQAPVSDFSAGSTHYMAPADFATIYDVAPLYQQGINGTGQSVAIVGRSNINISDIRQFRSTFGLQANDPQIVVNGANPGILNDNEEAEADLDVEWSGAVARNATIKFVVSASTNASDGSYLSAQYIVNQNLAPVMSMSFGLCEAALGTAGNSFINRLWQQAASQGISVFVSSGDSGAAGCDSASSIHAVAGRAVNGLCSSPYSVCVGGTQFSDSNYSLYWAASNSWTLGSAVGYIPEAVWNASGASGLWSGGGGVSSIYAKPVWQNGAGVPADGKRDVPDVSLTAAVHDGYLIFMNGSDMVSGGTSAASPSFAGLMALVIESTAARQGDANTAFYSLANDQRAGGAAVFHDVTAGNNSVPGVTGFSATAGYDQASGLGSVDANVLINNWSAGAGAAAFHLSLSTYAVSVVRGGVGASLSARVSLSGGFNAPITFALTGLPSGVSASFVPASLAAPGAGMSVLRLTAASGAKPGKYAVTISAAASSGVTQSGVVSLTVN